MTEIMPDAILESFADLSPDAPDVLDALKEIPTELANILSLNYICGKRCHEIAEITNQSITTIRRKKAEAIKMLEGILRK